MADGGASPLLWQCYGRRPSLLSRMGFGTLDAKRGGAKWGRAHEESYLEQKKLEETEARAGNGERLLCSMAVSGGDLWWSSG
jgi:hypothetical protein